MLSILIVVISFVACHNTPKTNEKQPEILEMKTIIPPCTENSIPNYAHWYERMAIFAAEKDSIRDNCVIFLGNSIIEGFDLDAFFPGTGAINRGISSDNIVGLIQRLDICIGDVKNARLFVMIGINDIGAQKSEKDIKACYSTMVNKIANRPSYTVYLHSILPTSEKWSNCPPQKIRNMNRFIEQMAQKHNMEFVNIYPLFAAENSEYVNDSLMYDGLHPNNSGYKLWADFIDKYVNK